MFRNRNNSQKPNDEFLASFRQNFPSLGAGQISSTSKSSGQSASATAQGGSLQPSHEQDGHQNIMKDAADLTPSRFTLDQWRLTPSLFDPNSFPLGSAGNGQMGYYTPTPGGINAVYHIPAAGDLHTPGLAFQLGTPLSLPLSDHALHAGSVYDHNAFNPQLFHHHSFDANHLFPQQPHPDSQHPHQQHQHAYPPSMLVHKDSGFGASHESPGESLVPQSEQQSAELAPATSLKHQTSHSTPAISHPEHFRYHVTLNAPTAMIRSSEEVPVTYLNKGQAYTMSIIDSMPIAPTPGTVKYRTTIRISFEDEQQRQKPSACWQLWKEGRGLAEAHHRGGKLQAVEFVDPHPGAEDDPRRPKIELEHASFDSFVVVWSPPLTASSAECAIAVRFNFLSTDFSHSKGVKGIPVRLCAKTHMLVPGRNLPEPPDAEVCYSKVKLFRDHGAERKLSNDVAHVKKTIDKLKQQIAQVESGIKEVGRKKRTSIGLGKPSGERPAKLAKHKRTWSVSSGGSGGKGSVEEDLHEKLAAVQEMFTSTRPVSILYLKGDEDDDPDKFPVSLPGDAAPELMRTASWDRRGSEERSATGSTLASPVATTRPLPKSHSSDWPQSARTTDGNFAVPTIPTKIQRGDSIFEATEVDSSYVPPEPVDRAIACLYVKRQMSDSTEYVYHKAVYLWRREATELSNKVCHKLSIDPTRVERVLRVTSNGLVTEVDDDVVRQLPEGQDMLIDFEDILNIKAEGAIAEDVVQSTSPLVLKLYY